MERFGITVVNGIHDANVMTETNAGNPFPALRARADTGYWQFVFMKPGWRKIP
jgi:hypothetical protein